MANPLPSNPKASSYRNTVAVLVSLFVIVQPVASLLSQHYLQQPTSGSTTYREWSEYLKADPPDILFLGDSRADIDYVSPALANDLAVAKSRPVRFGRLGIPAANWTLLEGLAGRIVERSRRPKLVVISLSEFQFNKNYVYDPTDDLVQISQPFGVSSFIDGLRLDPFHDRYLEDVLLPAVANYRLISLGLQQDASDRWSQLSRPGISKTATTGAPSLPATSPPPTPSGLASPQPPAPSPSAPPSPQQQVPQYAQVMAIYRDIYMLNYAYSLDQEMHLNRAIDLIRGAGSNVVLVIPPVIDIDGIDPAGYAHFIARMHVVGATDSITLIDRHDSTLRLHSDFWMDPSHLNERGAAAFAAEIFQAISVGLDA
jgi:hypothetical protein